MISKQKEGIWPIEGLRVMVEAAGFSDITITDKEKSDEIIKGLNFGEGVENTVFLAYIQAKKILLTQFYVR